MPNKSDQPKTSQVTFFGVLVSAILEGLNSRWGKRICIFSACLLVLGYTSYVILGWAIELKKDLQSAQDKLEKVDNESVEVGESLENAQGVVQDSTAILVYRIDALEAEMDLLQAELNRKAKDKERSGVEKLLDNANVAAREVVVDSTKKDKPKISSLQVKESGAIVF